ncbi:TPA: hypothetical protein ACI7EM_000764 [Escherichia coli]|uniref:Uncharacterized protein n=1 Tax=Salmonella enterica subsp. enterica serovar Kentucky TaxID=192955 RepID=A0A5Y2CHY3_SALET|nr:MULTISPECIES: hypothetical protein [Enterobacteriaceae]EBV7305628.1 hypothetical protein [Salmonella enterica subsp. enterica serovar Lexington]EBS2662578.1 hypothetical protein [Salmonella enterica subsp. enterica serovar Kentucky]EBS3257005.1 hypothetical protein [Salmonella enterica subsp. enterica serovar Kentucky]EBS5325117.1 hypothetical protein [Salmonella enterica subsp. enterica serovar Kentucky]EBW6776319.1 hypothetical protein [Salmonella enterica subsp. enterica serovar Kentucky
MKQMSLIEMDGFLKGKCIPRDLKVNETNAEYLVRKFGELESKLETALRECRSAGITIDNLEAKCAALDAEKEKFAVECAATKIAIAYLKSGRQDFSLNTTATDAFLAEVRAQGVEMYADNLDNGADDAERGGFDYAVKFLRSEASGVRLFADQLRKGGSQ